MSDEAVDIYPLTVEEYETADVVSADVEVEFEAIPATCIIT